MDSEKVPQWACQGEPQSTIELGQLLSYARQNYVAHTDWYLRHRDAGIRLLGGILLINVTIGGLYFDDKIHAYLAVLTLSILAILAIVLSALSSKSCRQAYSASLEHALMATKTAWAMGFSQKIIITKPLPLGNGCPAKDDESLYVPRYIKDSLQSTSTASFVDTNISKHGNTYFSAKLTLWALGTASSLMALGLILAICVGLKCP